MPIKLKNNASGFLATAISASDTGLVLQTGNGAAFPTLAATDYFYATLVSTGGTQEVVKVTARVGDTMTVVRAQDNTSAQSFAAGSHIEMRVNAQAILDAAGLNRVFVDAFGAVGDGVTNDTVAIQAAIDYVAANGGGTVLGTTKTYLALGIVVKSKVVLRDIKLKTAVALVSSSSCVQFDTSATDAAIINVEVDGNKANQSVSNVAGIDVWGTRNRVLDCHVYNTKRTGIRMFPGCTYCDVSRNNIHDVDGFGITHELSTTVASYYCTVSFNNVVNTGISAINFIAGDAVAGASAGIKHWKITNNTVINTGLDTIAGAIGGYSPNNEHVLIANNVIENANNHMHHVGGDFISIIGNIGKEISNGGILIRNWPNDGGGVGAPIGKGCVVSGNIVHLSRDSLGQNAGDGISIQHYTDFIVSGNQVYGSANCGIRVRGEVLGSTTRRTTDGAITGNVIGESDGVTIHTFTENGIAVEASDRVTVSGNAVNKSYESNIAIRGSRHVSVVGNMCAGSKTGSGILVIQSGAGSVDTRYVTVQGNTCTGNSGHGIQTSGTISDVSMVGNMSLQNGAGQILLSTLNSSIVALNDGLRTRNGGTASVVNGSAITHFVEDTVTRYRVTPTKANRVAAVTAVSSTTLTISLTDLAGAPITVPEFVNWEASSELT